MTNSCVMTTSRTVTNFERRNVTARPASSSTQQPRAASGLKRFLSALMRSLAATNV